MMKDITMAQTLIKMKEEKAKEKGVSIKDVDDSSRPARSILTLKPLLTIDPKDKVVEDKSSGDKGENVEELVSTVRPEVSTGRPDTDAARQEDSVVEPRTPPTTTSIFDDEDITMAQTLIKMKEEKAKGKRFQAKMDASKRSLAARLQMEEREMYTIEERSKLLAEFFERRKKLLAEERVAALNKKTFEEIQALYINKQERDADFMPIGLKNEKIDYKMNKKQLVEDLRKRF
ncbi:hypothetical protein Tco_0562758 [Tanacetum coccineum]